MSTFVQAIISGLALGATYALVALGFSIVFRSSRIVNFAQGALVLLGAYLISWLVVSNGLPFFLALVLVLIFVAGVSAALDMAVLRRLNSRDSSASVIITLAFGIAIEAVAEIFFSTTQRPLGEPWDASVMKVVDASILVAQLCAIATAVAVAAAFVALDRGTILGRAMRASASDEEAALTVGIPTWRIRTLAWSMAGGLAVLAGVFLTAYPSAVTPSVSAAALAAFPALVLGGLDAPVGALVGGAAIGVLQVLAGTYQPDWLGQGAHAMVPYVIMIVILLIRPYGLFGSRPKERL